MNYLAEAKAVVVYDRYFEVFLPAFFNEVLLQEARGLSCRFGFRLAGDAGGLWVLTLEEGMLRGVERTQISPECWFETSATTFVAVVSGEMSAQEAFFAGKVDVLGDVELGLKLSFLLGPFFEQYPYHA